MKNQILLVLIGIAIGASIPLVYQALTAEESAAAIRKRCEALVNAMPYWATRQGRMSDPVWQHDVEKCMLGRR